MTERTIGQKIGQWLTNVKLLMTMISLLGLSSIYGNSETVKQLVHGKAEIVEPVVIEVVKPVEHKHDNHNDRFSKIEKRIKNLESKVNSLKEWHE